MIGFRGNRYRIPCVAQLAIASLILAGPACKKTEKTSSKAPDASGVVARKPDLPVLNPFTTPEQGSVLDAKITLRIGSQSGFITPRSVAVDESGNVYVADTGNARIVKFDPSGREILKFGKKGTGPGEFGEPWRIAVSPEGKVLVLDRATQFIQVFTPAGKYVSRYGGPSAQLYFPGGFAISKDGTPVVADTGNGRVAFLGPEGAPPTLSINKVGIESFNQPPEVAVDPAGNLLVLGLGGPGNKGRLVKLSPTGAFISEWVVVSVPSTRDTPRIAIAPDGRIVMTDPGEKRVVIFSSDMSTFHPIRMTGEPATSFKLLSGIAVDRQGRFWVVDVDEGLVYRFEL